MTVGPDQIERFLHGQVEAWNAHDKAAFFGLYKAFTPKGLTIDYVGQAPRDAWAILDDMWAKQNDKVEIEVVNVIVNGTEAACHHRNHVTAAGFTTETIELYAFGEDELSVRYFIAAPR
jgi:hypothetical protein